MEAEVSRKLITSLPYIGGAGLLFSALGMARKYFQGGICTATTKLDGKVVLITGGNTGIGKETAIDLAKRGAKVYIACRDEKRGSDALVDIKKESGSDNVHLRIMDLASFASIRDFVKNFIQEEQSLHILINNAGVMRCPYWKTEDGLEMQIGVNHFGHFLLTNLLLDTIKASQPARIVTVSSLGHIRGTINFDDINSEKAYRASRAYAQSKLANILFTNELHKRLEGSNVSVFSLHPGVIKTELARHWQKEVNPIKWNLMMFMGAIFFKTPKQGAQTTIYCAVEPGLEKESGKYFSDCKVKEPAAVAKDDGVAKKLWELSESIVGI